MQWPMKLFFGKNIVRNPQSSPTTIAMLDRLLGDDFGDGSLDQTRAPRVQRRVNEAVNGGRI